MSALKNISIDQAKSIKWVQWTPGSGILTAFAVDPTSEERTGKLRSINGSLIPASAVDAEKSTPRDHFCTTLVERLLAGDIGKSKVDPRKLEARAAIKAKKEEARLEKATAKAEAKAARSSERTAALEAKKAEKAKAKAEKAFSAFSTLGARAAAALVEKGTHPESTAGCLLQVAPPPCKEGSYLVVRNGEQIGIVAPGKLIETDDAADPKVVVTGKAWAVYQGKDRKAFGLIKPMIAATA